MTGLEFFASIGLPAALVVCSYVAVVIYEWTSQPGSDDSN
jgi:hypothetical protein